MNQHHIEPVMDRKLLYIQSKLKKAEFVCQVLVWQMANRMAWFMHGPGQEGSAWNDPNGPQHHQNPSIRSLRWGVWAQRILKTTFTPTTACHDITIQGSLSSQAVTPKLNLYTQPKLIITGPFIYFDLWAAETNSLFSVEWCNKCNLKSWIP